MADRRKREIGQIWKCPYSQGYGGYFIGHGDYQIVDIFNVNGTKMFALADLRRGGTLFVPSKAVSSAESRRWSFVRDGAPAYLVPRVIRCRSCEAADVRDIHGTRYEYFTCKFCGRMQNGSA